MRRKQLNHRRGLSLIGMDSAIYVGIRFEPQTLDFLTKEKKQTKASQIY